MPLSELHHDVHVRTRINRAHVALLAEVLDDCPPIVVTADRTVVDGAHRFEAALSLGRTFIPARTIDLPSREDVLLEAVRANTAHGLPLTRQERQNAVELLLHIRPELSDRTLAEVCGVSRALVGALRKRQTQSSGGPDGHLNKRVGADGKQYPATHEANRSLAAALVRTNPDLSVRALAERLGVSVGTAQRYRQETLQKLGSEHWLLRIFRRLLAWWRLSARLR